MAQATSAPQSPAAVCCCCQALLRMHAMHCCSCIRTAAAAIHAATWSTSRKSSGLQYAYACHIRSHMKHEVLHGLKLLLTHAHHLALIWICHVMKCCGHVANRLAQRGTLGSDLCPLCKRTVLFVVLAKCVCVMDRMC